METPGKVNCHCLSPGMVPASESFQIEILHRSDTKRGLEVFTDLLLNDSTPELRKFPFGVLAAQPEEAPLGFDAW